MRVNHEKTAEFVQESTPLRRYQQVALNFSENRMGAALREVEERMVLKEKVLALKPKWFYMRKEGNMYKGVVGDVPDPRIRVEFPKISVL